jgi:transcriptional regulator with XRE-family HTH domain
VRKGRNDALSVGEVRVGFGQSREKFGRLTGFSVRALAGWESGERKPGPQARRRFAELSRLLDALSGTVRREAIPPWMETPNPAFDGLKPIEIIERGQIDRLWRMVYELELGTPV